MRWSAPRSRCLRRVDRKLCLEVGHPGDDLDHASAPRNGNQGIGRAEVTGNGHRYLELHGPRLRDARAKPLEQGQLSGIHDSAASREQLRVQLQPNDRGVTREIGHSETRDEAILNPADV